MLRGINMRQILSVVKRCINQGFRLHFTRISICIAFHSDQYLCFTRITAIPSLSRFGQIRGQNSQNLKDTKDRTHDTLTTVKILASNSKVSSRYESRKSAYEQRDYRLLRSRTEMAVIPKPELQTTNRRMFWNRHT
ncbi:hypothetical protein LXL04_022872 [Taraxacum kok-saghyz]